MAISLLPHAQQLAQLLPPALGHVKAQVGQTVKGDSHKTNKMPQRVGNFWCRPGGQRSSNYGYQLGFLVF